MPANTQLETRVEANTRLGRSRFLAGLSIVLFGMAGRLFWPEEAFASCGACEGYSCCGCCNSWTCCQSSCYYSSYLGCRSGGQCWYTCVNNKKLKCCDYSRHNSSACICSGYVPRAWC